MSNEIVNMQMPPIIFGTSGLGNIYESVPYEIKLAIVKACIENSPSTPVFDTAGKYGAGLSLEVLGKCLEELNVAPENVIISNKLGWYQIPLTTPEPTFEKGVWVDLKNDAVQKISYEGILECYHQGNNLLGKYDSQMASVHDPDEYLAAALNKEDEVKRYNDILDAYKALHDLKKDGKVQSVGVGAKNWRSIERISKDVQLDWVMFANSLTIHAHEKALLNFIASLKQKEIVIINSAVFNGGFLVGKNFYNYAFVDKNTVEGKALFKWRNDFFEVCETFKILPAEACVYFGLHAKGVQSIAMSTSVPHKVKSNIEMANKQIPAEFWQTMQQKNLLDTALLSF